MKTKPRDIASTANPNRNPKQEYDSMQPPTTASLAPIRFARAVSLGLVASLVAAAGVMPAANAYLITPVARYTFETDNGSPVVNGQAVTDTSRVDDVSGQGNHMIWANYDPDESNASYQSTATSPAGPVGGDDFRLYFNPVNRGYYGHLEAPANPDFNTGLGGNLESFVVSFDYQPGNVRFGESLNLASSVNRTGTPDRPDYTVGGTGWMIGITQSSGNLTIWLRTRRVPGGPASQLQYVYAASDASWHNVQFIGWSVDETTIFGELYIDGALVDSGSMLRPVYNNYAPALFGNSRPGPAFRIDNFMLAAIPEPTSLALLGLASLTLLHRRRRW